MLLSQLPTYAQAGNAVKAWSRSIFFSSFRDFDATYGWYDVYFTTPDGSTTSFPLYYTDPQGAMSFSDEMRQRGTSSFFDTDFAVWNESPYNVWSQFGSMSLYMPVNDNNGNGVPDWLERENSANELVTGSYSIHWPTPASYTPTARLTRSAGSLSGTYTLRVGAASGTTTSGTWTVVQMAGTVTMNSTAGTATFSVSFNDGPTLTGSTAFTVQSSNQITLATLTLTGGGFSDHTIGNTVLARTGNRYVGAMAFADGFDDSPWADFTNWAMEIMDATAPTATITSPAANPSYQTSSASISLSGTSADDIGVTQVTWSNNLGGSGTASGSTAWTASGVELKSGTNVITVTVRDAAGNAGQATRTIICSPLVLVGSRQGNNFVLKWPTNAVGFTLESATNLPAASWTSNSTPASIVGAQFTVTNAIAGGKKFYRLRHP